MTNNVKLIFSRLGYHRVKISNYIMPQQCLKLRTDWNFIHISECLADSDPLWILGSSSGSLYAPRIRQISNTKHVEPTINTVPSLIQHVNRNGFSFHMVLFPQHVSKCLHAANSLTILIFVLYRYLIVLFCSFAVWATKECSINKTHHLSWSVMEVSQWLVFTRIKPWENKEESWEALESFSRKMQLRRNSHCSAWKWNISTFNTRLNLNTVWETAHFQQAK